MSARIAAVRQLEADLKGIGETALPMLLALGAFIALAWTLVIVGDAVFLDFSNELWLGAKAVLDGVSPYPPLDEVATSARFVFPAPAAS